MSENTTPLSRSSTITIGLAILIGIAAAGWIASDSSFKAATESTLLHIQAEISELKEEKQKIQELELRVALLEQANED